MSSKHIGADFNYAWPSAEIAVMGPQAAVSIIFKREIAAAKDPAKKAEELVQDYKEKFANPYVAAERGFVDDVIEPQETRSTLIRSLHLLRDKHKPGMEGEAGAIACFASLTYRYSVPHSTGSRYHRIPA